MTISSCTIERKTPALAALSIAAQRAENFHIHPRERRRAAGAAPAAIVSAIVKMADHQITVARALECDGPSRRGVAVDGLLLGTRGVSETPLGALRQGAGRRWFLKGAAQRILRWQAKQEWDSHWCIVADLDPDTGEQLGDDQPLFLGTRDQMQRGIRGRSTIACGNAIGPKFGGDRDAPPAAVTLTRKEAITANGEVHDGVAISGIYRCKSAYVCPCCEVSAARQLKQRVEGFLDAIWDRGGEAYLLTLTLRHSLHTSLAELQEIERKAFRAMTTGSSYKRLAKRFHIIGQPKVSENMYGSTAGHHPHFHVAVACLEQHTDGEVEELGDVLKAKWVKAVRKLGGQASFSRQDMRRIRPGEVLDEYLAKGSLRACGTAASEIAGTYAKTGRLPTSLSMGQVLALAADSQDPETSHKFGCIFLEYAQGFIGRRQFIITPKMRNILGIEDADEEADPPDDAAHPDLTIDWAVWGNLGDARHAQPLIIAAVSRGDVQEAEAIIHQVIVLPTLEARRRWQYKNRDRREFERIMASIMQRCRAAGSG